MNCDIAGVEVSMFLKFNKIKTLLEEKGLEIGEVVKAVRGSELLEVSTEGLKIVAHFPFFFCNKAYRLFEDSDEEGYFTYTNNIVLPKKCCIFFIYI